VEWAEVPRAGRWLEEAGGNADDGLTTYRMCLRIGHMVMVGSPYHMYPPPNGDVLIASQKEKRMKHKEKREQNNAKKELGLGTSALVGDPDPYPRVFGRQISHPDP